MTIFALELTTIKIALQWAIDNINHDINIFSDSYSSLQEIAAGKSNRGPNLLMEVEGLVNKYNRSVTFIWLPSHIGIKENESADSLANLATANCNIDLAVRLELSETYSLVDDYIINKWQKNWDNGNNGSHYS